MDVLVGKLDSSPQAPRPILDLASVEDRQFFVDSGLRCFVRLGAGKEPSLMSLLRVCCALVLAPALAVAQAAPGVGGTPAPVEDPPPPEAMPEAPVETHTVQRGDTLWDLSARYLNSPWYWPKVWSYNPEIGNPHWIYPGNVIRFRRAMPQQPGASPQAEPAQDPEEDAEAKRELEWLSVADMEKPQHYGDRDDVTVGGPYRIGYQPRGSVRLRQISFVTPGQLADSGTITGAFEDKLLLTVYDPISVSFREGVSVRPGATYMLYQTEGPVRHPVTGDLFGYKSRVLGAAKVIALEPGGARLEVTQAFEPIDRGTLVATWSEAVTPRAVRPRPNRSSMSGFIVATHQQILSAVGEHAVVFVDRGRTDGVEEGNLFTVVRAGDPFRRDSMEHVREGWNSTLPTQDVGLLMVVDTQETASAALVVRSMRELHIGDRVEMRGPAGVPAGKGAPAESRTAAEPR
jgi:hypothetical protein